MCRQVNTGSLWRFPLVFFLEKGGRGAAPEKNTQKAFLLLLLLLMLF
jgi:hypothetical protein